MSSARIRCMCGSAHNLPLARALDGAGVAHWQCTDCRRRFVLAFQAPDSFTPIYLDTGVRSIDTRQTGAANPTGVSINPAPPPAIDFKCRCGHRITAHSWQYGGTLVCTSCRATLYLALKYNLKQKQHVIVPEYPHTATSA